MGLGWWWQNFGLRRGKYQDLIPAFYLMGVLKLSYYQPVELTTLMNAYLAFRLDRRDASKS